MGDRRNIAISVAEIFKGLGKGISDMKTNFPDEKLTDINDNC